MSKPHDPEFEIHLVEDEEPDEGRPTVRVLTDPVDAPILSDVGSAPTEAVKALDDTGEYEPLGSV